MRFSILVLLAFALAFPAAAQVTGISYTAAPVGVRLLSGDNTGLSNGYLYGGALGLGFGEYLEVSGVYLRSTDITTEFSDYNVDPFTRSILEGQAEGFDVDLEQYGTRLRLTVGRGSLLPFIVGGTGVLRFDNGSTDSEAIFAEAGVGITFAFQDRYTITVEGSRLGYRYNPYATFDLGNTAALPTTSELNQIRRVYSNAITATARVYLGGRARGELTETDLAVREQLRRPRVFAEPSYGIIQFSDDLVGLPNDQPVLGLQAGIDLGPYVGLRGFYLRATDEDELFSNPTEFRDLALYGAEINFRFSSELAGGLTPYLLLGGGYMDVGNGYRAGSSLLAAPESRYFAMGGGGVDVALNSAFRLKAGVRALLMSNEDADQVSDPASVYYSLMPTAGVEFSLGGGSPSSARRDIRDAQERELERQAREAGLAVGAREAQLDSLRLAYDLARAEAELVGQLTPEQVAERAALEAQIATLQAEAGLPVTAPVAAPAPARSNLSARTMEVPIPENGEIYIRFGGDAGETAAAPVVIATPQGLAVAGQPAAGQPAAQPGAAVSTEEQVAQVVRQTLAADSARVSQQRIGVDGLVQRELDDRLRQERATNELTARLEARIAELEGRLSSQIAAGNANAAGGGTTTVVVDEEGAGGFSLTRVGSRSISNVYPVLGIRTGEGQTQGQFAIRGEYRTVTRTGAIFVPEIGFGFADGVSLSLLGNFFFQNERNFGRGLQPYYGIGGGLLTRNGFSGTGLALNLAVGADYPLGPGALVGEISTLDLFQYTRVLFGYKLSF